jgi:hypothetical protein
MTTVKKIGSNSAASKVAKIQREALANRHFVEPIRSKADAERVWQGMKKPDGK